MANVVRYTVSTDPNDILLEGIKYYKLHFHVNIPECKFWSVIVYDKETNLMILTDQPWPSVYSNCKKMVNIRDGSFDVFYGPKVSLEKEGKNHYVMNDLR